MKAPRQIAPLSKKLRNRAERLLSTTRREIAEMPVDDVQKLVHELQVHQIELEMQNEELRRTKTELELAKDRYVELYDFAPCAHLTLNAQGEILDASLSAGELFGRERDSLIHQKFTRFLPAESQDTFYLFHQQVMNANGRQSTELELVNAQTKRMFVHVEAVNETINHRRQCRLSFSDITQRKRTEEALLEASQLNRQIIADAKEGIIVYDRELKYVVWNPFMEELTGLPATEVIGKHPLELFPFLKAAKVVEQIHEVLADRAVKTIDFFFQVPQTGCSGWASDTTAPLRNARGEITGAIGIVNDITKRKQVEQALQESQQFSQNVVNSLTAHIAIVDHRGQIIAVNQRWRDFAARNGAAPGTMSEGINYFSACLAGVQKSRSIAAMTAGLRAVLTGRKRDFQYEYSCHAPTKQRWFAMRVTQFFSNGERRAVIAHEDISERRRAEERVSQLNRVLAIMAGIDRAIIHIPDRQKLLKVACRVAVKIGGFKLAWIGVAAPDGSVLPVAKAGLTKYLNGIRVVTHNEPAGQGPVGVAIRENRRVVIENIERDQRMLPWRHRAAHFGLHYIAAFPIRIEDKAIGAFAFYAPEPDFFDENELGLLTQVSNEISYALTAMADLKGRKQAEEALSRSERNLSIFFNQAPIGLLWLAADGTILRVNQALLNLSGHGRQEYLAHLFSEFFTEESGERNLLKRLAAKETVRNLRMVAVCKNGATRQVLVDATPIWSGQEFLYSSIFLRDITDRVLLEQEIINVSEREHRRIAQDLHDGLGQLLGGAAYLVGNLRQDLADKSLPEARQSARILEVITEGIAMTRNLARGLHPVEPEPNGLMAALQALAERTRKLFGVRCRFICRQPVLIQDNLIATHLFRIAQEAITNGIKHGKAGRIEINLNETPGRINLAVSNNGTDMPAQLHHKSGMGLRIMRYRAGMIGGSLAIQKSPNGGITIACTVDLAAAGKPPSRPETTPRK